MPKAKTKHKHRPRNVIKTLAHVGAKAGIGAEARLEMLSTEAAWLHIKGHTLMQIARTLAEKHQLERVPHIQTVVNWIDRKNEKADKEILPLINHLRLEDLNRLEETIAILMPIVTANKLSIERLRTVDGIPQMVLDERTEMERCKAVDSLIKTLARKARLFGLDMADSKDDPASGTANRLDIQMMIIRMMSNETKPVDGAPIDAECEVLTLETGIAEIDAKIPEEVLNAV